MERLIEDLLGELPEPIRSEALDARRKAVERGNNVYSRRKTAKDHAEAIDSFDWHRDGGDDDKWYDIYRRADAGEFNGPSELDRLRARVAELEAAAGDPGFWGRAAARNGQRVAELEEALETLTEQAERAGWQGMSVHHARSILNNK
jgi:hypothetical protein